MVKSICEKEDLSNLKEFYKDKKIGWTNGCFYIIHPGHINYIENAKNHCDILFVGVNDDYYLENAKNKKRIFNEDERLYMMSRVKGVDHVVLFKEKNVIPYLEILKPNCYIKGGDYTIDTINQDERRFVESYGGEVIIINKIYEHSSTKVYNNSIAELLYV